MRKTISFLLSFLTASLSAFLLMTSIAYAMPACPDPVPYRQPTGAIIQVTQRGDEFLTWSEDANGYLILFDEVKNGYCYANWADNGPISTGELVGASVFYGPQQQRESGADIPKVVLENAALLREEARPILDDPLVASAPANRSGASVVNSLEELRRNLLIIYVRWGDESNITYSNTGDKIPPLNGKQIYELVFDSNTRSMNDYYKEMLGFQDDLILPADVTNPMNGYPGIVEVTLPGQHTNPGGDTTRRRELLRSAITAADQYIDFSHYDTNNNEYLYANELSIGVIVHGYEATAAGMSSVSPNYWGNSSHTSFGSLDGVQIRSIFGVGAFQSRTGDTSLTIGGLSHEYGHSAYNFVDTYDTGKLGDGNSYGHGYWSLMGSGSWGYQSRERAGASPAYVDAYNLVANNLVTPGTISSSANEVILHAPTDIYKVTNTVNTGQYFLLQQRKYGISNNYDRGAFYRIYLDNASGGQPSSATGGMLIYHIDESVSSLVNDKNTHYRAAIEEAHGGIQHLQQVMDNGNDGDFGDLWGASIFEFSPSSDPKSGLYSAYTNDTVAPNQDTASDITISNITWNSVGGFTMFSGGANTVTLERITVTASPTKLSYFVGETLDLTGLIVTGTYSDGSSKPETVTMDNITNFNSTAANPALTVTVTVGSKTATFIVEINDLIVTINLRQELADAKATFSVTNNSGSNKSVLLLLSIYNGKGQMASIKTDTATITNGSYAIKDLNLSIPVGYTAKAFVWDGVTYVPLVESTQIIGV